MPKKKNREKTANGNESIGNMEGLNLIEFDIGIGKYLYL